MGYFRLKLLRLFPVLVLVTFASFVMISLLPGDVVDSILNSHEMAGGNAAAREALLAQFDLDRPVVLRYFSWLGHFLQGDLGRSAVTTQPVFQALVARLPVSLELVVLAQLFAVTIAVPLGVLSAYHAGGLLDRTISIVVFSIMASPVFVIAVSLIFLFAITWQLLPSAGYVPLGTSLIGNLRTFALPALAIGLAEIPVLLRVLRSDMITTLQEDFIALARAKGLSPTYILLHHALRPSSFTLITAIGLQMGSLIAGAVIVETIFGLPGIGKLLIEAIDGRDVVMVQGVVTVVAIIYVLINFVVDMLYGLLDPRIAATRR